jgi:hypothetical protein
MTDATIAANIHQSLDVHLNFGTESAFYFILIVDDVTKGVLLIVSPVLNFLVFVDAGFCQNLRSKTSSYYVDIGLSYKAYFFFG